MLFRLVIVSNHVLVHDQAVLVHDRFEGVDDPKLLLSVRADRLNRTAVPNAHQVGLEEPFEHPLPEVLLDKNDVHALVLGVLSDPLEYFLIKAARVPPNAVLINRPIELLGDRQEVLFQSAPGGVNEHRRPGLTEELVSSNKGRPVKRFPT